jgi:hypothetical protein
MLTVESEISSILKPMEALSFYNVTPAFWQANETCNW